MIRRTILAAIATVLMLPTLAKAADPVKIGVALSQTGNLADSAAPYFKGLDLWREQANARGGLAGPSSSWSMTTAPIPRPRRGSTSA
jgi:branched-chain amino acid transport system substrate-binding protein